tara:strand:+ start:165050 stop:166345 length:1296 start_codon:yes stop_codon:yes gene_type:complete
MSGANPGLGYEATPPFSAPLRFFLTAPLFGIVAGLVLIGDSGLLASRWTPGTLAVVHLFAVGFLLQIMLGALIQIMPVVAGAALPAPLLTARLTHVGLSLGAAGLAAGLGFGLPVVLIGAAALLGLSIFGFLGCATVAIIRAPKSSMASHTPRDLRLSLTGLALAVVLGLSIALGLSGGAGLPLPFTTQVNLHAGWALLGWAGILLAAVSWVVVPMFQITPAYPVALTRYWAPAILGLLCAWSVLSITGFDQTAIVLALALIAAVICFAGITLRQQARTRRSTPDASFRAFRLAMVTLIAGAGLLAFPHFSDAEHWPVLAGILVLHGGLGGATSAMLYKIVPFLAWLHLTQAKVKAPNVKKMLPDARAKAQLRMHVLALAALLAAALAPALGALAGLALIVEFGWLMLNLLHVVRMWRANAPTPQRAVTPA